MGLLFLSAALLVASVPENPDLKRGEELFAEYKYPEAIKALARARAVKGLDRESLLRILELTGVSAGQQRQTAVAQAAFREMLVLDPTRQLATEYAPRVMTPFYEVRQQVLEAGALEFKPRPAVTGPAGVESVGVSLVRDPLGMARGVRFHLLSADGWKELAAPLKGGGAILPVGAPEARWWAELLGENESVLALVGSEAAPRVEAPAPAVAIAPRNEPIVEVKQARAGSPLRGISYAVLGGAAVSAGVGAWFGVQSADAFAQIRRASVDGSGRIDGLTERRAHELDAQGKQNATIANALFITAGALAVGGVVIWFLGAPVTVSPAPAGVVVAGALP
ncbi:MAG: uncharacterized protein H6Q89_2201 [Myxococcaceae bacterium]|nr:uncharacterized protein [Myxococcaceae bacterium]